jgi:hypothetical protein
MFRVSHKILGEQTSVPMDRIEAHEVLVCRIVVFSSCQCFSDYIWNIMHCIIGITNGTVDSSFLRK